MGILDILALGEGEVMSRAEHERVDINGDTHDNRGVALRLSARLENVVHDVNHGPDSVESHAGGRLGMGENNHPEGLSVTGSVAENGCNHVAAPLPVDGEDGEVSRGPHAVGQGAMGGKYERPPPRATELPQLMSPGEGQFVWSRRRSTGSAARTHVKAHCYPDRRRSDPGTDVHHRRRRKPLCGHEQGGLQKD